MNKQLFIVSILILGLSILAIGQDSRALRAAKMSFNSAEDHYKRENYKQAKQEFLIVTETIPANIESRRYLIMRLESLINLIDISFYKIVNIEDACEHLNSFFDTMNTIRNRGVLNARQLLHYQQIEKDCMDQHVVKCEGYENIHDDMDEFRKNFESEFDD